MPRPYSPARDRAAGDVRGPGRHRHRERPVVRRAPAEQPPSSAEALEQQTATAEVLRVIASSPTDLQPVLDAIVASAGDSREATDASVWRVDGDVLRFAACAIQQITDRFRRRRTRSVRSSDPARWSGGPGTAGGPCGRLRSTWAGAPSRIASITTASRLSIVVATPLMRKATSIGVLVVSRSEVRPFSDGQIALLETFADQAVIAIENARLFEELEERTRELARVSRRAACPQRGQPGRLFVARSPGSPDDDRLARDPPGRCRRWHRVRAECGYP